MIYIEGEVFNEKDYSESFLQTGEYENCSFSNCNFSNSDLSEIKFIDCSFHECDLSMVQLHKTAFREVRFNNCKMLGLHFEDSYQLVFSVDFDQCLLNLSSFVGVGLQNITFNQCSLQEVDFAQANLSNAQFSNTDLSNSVFEKTNLEKADFRTAFNFRIDPELNRLKGAKFSLEGVMGLLDKYGIVVE